jgi:hypothetical protein
MNNFKKIIDKTNILNELYNNHINEKELKKELSSKFIEYDSPINIKLKNNIYKHYNNNNVNLKDILLKLKN